MSWRDTVFIAKVVTKKGVCNAGHKVGDEFEINTHKTGGICGYCYHDLFPVLMTLVMGGKVPWFKDTDEFTYECPDKTNQVTFRIVRRKQY